MGVLKQQHGLTLLPAAPGRCEACATTHEPHLPHNAQSLHYQYHFYDQHGRWPTWADAMAHCDEPMRELWRKALKERGVDPDGVQVNPPSTPIAAPPPKDNQGPTSVRL